MCSDVFDMYALLLLYENVKIHTYKEEYSTRLTVMGRVEK